MRCALALVLSIFASVNSAFGGPILFSTGQLDQFQGERQLLAIDVDTGRVKSIGAGSTSIRMQGLAFAADGTLFGLQRNAGFVTIDVSTGAVSSISSALPGGGGQGNLVSGLAYNNGVLFTAFASDVSSSTTELLRYEIATDSLSTVGQFSVNGRIGAMAFSTDGRLVGDASPMYEINTNTAAATALPNSGAVVGGGFDFFSTDSIYHMAFGGDLASFNVFTGNRNLLHSIDVVDRFERVALAPDGLFSSFDDVAGELLVAPPPDPEPPSPIPEPSSLVLLGMGGLSLFGYGWRRRKMGMSA